jgi:hypothetical protein
VIIDGPLDSNVCYIFQGICPPLIGRTPLSIEVFAEILGTAHVLETAATFDRV